MRAPRVNDKRVDAAGQRERFTSRILPPYMRRSPKVAEVARCSSGVRSGLRRCRPDSPRGDSRSGRYLWVSRHPLLVLIRIGAIACAVQGRLPTAPGGDELAAA